MTSHRLIGAFFAAPLVPALGLLVPLALLGGAGEAFRLIAILVTVAYAGMVVLGLPLYALFVRGRKPSRLMAAAIGACVAPFPWLAFLLGVSIYAPGDGGFAAAMMFVAAMVPLLLLAAIAGVVGGIVAWQVAYGNPTT